MLPGLPARLAGVLATSHSIRVRVALLNLAGDVITPDLGAVVLDGSVNVDGTADITRSATLTLLDPDHHLAFDSDSPADGALYADRMVRIVYGVRAPGTAWIDVPIFTGPVTKFSRDGVEVTVEAQGKEALAKGSAWAARTFKKGALKTDVIHDIMADQGERSFDLMHSGQKLPTDRSLVADSVPWDLATEVAKSMGAQLFYDGSGRLVLRDQPGTPVFTFADGTGGTIVSTPKVEFSIDDVRNAVRVTGKAPKGKKGTKEPKHPPKIVGKAVAPSDHPLSPARLGRNGQPRYIAEFVDAPAAGTNAQAAKVAKARLAQLLDELVTVTFDALVVPHLDPGDVIAVRTSEFAARQRLSSFSLPLAVDGTMSVGYNRRTKVKRRRKKR